MGIFDKFNNLPGSTFRNPKGMNCSNDSTGLRHCKNVYRRGGKRKAKRVQGRCGCKRQFDTDQGNRESYRRGSRRRRRVRRRRRQGYEGIAGRPDDDGKPTPGAGTMAMIRYNDGSYRTSSNGQRMWDLMTNWTPGSTKPNRIRPFAQRGQAYFGQLAPMHP